MTDHVIIDAPSPVRVAAIDPGSVKAGLVVLQIQPPRPGFIVPDGDQVSILARHTARPRTGKGTDFAYRMSELLDLIERWTEDVRRNWSPDLWCVEDPRDFTQKQLRGRGAAVTLGAGFGLACAAFSVAAGRNGDTVTLVPAMDWYPKTRSGNRQHPMKHNAAREWLRTRWPALKVCTDDEVFASGMAIWAHTKGAMAATYPI